jgi:hypothetical protein
VEDRQQQELIERLQYGAGACIESKPPAPLPQPVFLTIKTFTDTGADGTIYMRRTNRTACNNNQKQ